MSAHNPQSQNGAFHTDTITIVHKKRKLFLKKDLGMPCHTSPLGEAKKQGYIG